MAELSLLALTNGTSKENNLNAVLRSILPEDFPNQIRGPRHSVDVILNVNDLMILTLKRFHV